VQLQTLKKRSSLVGGFSLGFFLSLLVFGLGNAVDDIFHVSDLLLGTLVASKLMDKVLIW
jgi:hypothetical protein